MNEVLERLPRRFVVASLLLVFVACGVYSLGRESATFDETAHLPAGFTYLDKRDFRHNPEHPPLAKAWAALPLWLGNLTSVDYDSPHWNGHRASDTDVARSRANQWLFGFEFLNGTLGSPVRKNPMRLLVPARVMILLLGVVLGLLVYDWAARMWGAPAALLSLFLFALSPTMLAHARYVTTDLPAALGFTATLYAFWRFLREPGWIGAAITGVALGLALLCKFSTLLLGLFLPLLAVLWIVRSAAGTGPASHRAGRVVVGLAIVAVVAWGVVWAGYGFRYAAPTDPDYRLEWESVTLDEGTFGRALSWAKENRAAPEAFLYGVASAQRDASRRLAFLNGEQRVTGWWYYFPEAFLLKTPPALFLLMLWVIAAGVARTRGASFDGWYLAVPVLVYFGISMAGNLNLGHRHLTPVYPLLFVAAGSAVKLAAGRARTIVLGVLLVLYAGSFAFATPRYLSYFNVLAGGPRGGWHYLVDSSIDWGQDLPRLRAFMEENDIPKIHLAYFGTADPRAYGIDYEKVLIAYDFYPDEPRSMPRSGDWFACSVTMLQVLYWDRDWEFSQLALLNGLVAQETVDLWLARRNEHIDREERFPGLADWLVAQGHVTIDERRAIEAGMLATWLDVVREQLTPAGYAGDSIRIYRIP